VGEVLCRGDVDFLTKEVIKLIELAKQTCLIASTKRRQRMFILRNYQILTGGSATVSKVGAAPGREF
jgi:hypothetical protein